MSIVLDTATGTGDLVQFLVGAVVLERGDGTTTDNLLAETKLVTFCDPSGEPSGLRLRPAPGGSYEKLHLMLVEGSGVRLRADGTTEPLQAVVDLVVPIADGLTHTANLDSWLAIGHDSAPVLLPSATGIVWTPRLAGRFDGSGHELDGLVPAFVEGTSIASTVPVCADGLLRIELDPACELSQDDVAGAVTRATFLDGLGGEDELRVRGELRRDGTFRAVRAHRGRGNDGPRLLGRIVELRPTVPSFVLRVQAEVRRGDRRLLAVPIDVEVLTANARLHRPNHAALAFGDLAVGQLAKVKVRSRQQVPGGLTQIIASEVEITSGDGVPPQPEWQGRVQSVDLPTRTIVVERRNDDPIVIGGVSLQTVTVHVAAGTPIQRRERNGSGRFAIELSGIVPTQDRIWFRGTVMGPDTVDATWVRVRED